MSLPLGDHDRFFENNHYRISVKEKNNAPIYEVAQGASGRSIKLIKKDLSLTGAFKEITDILFDEKKLPGLLLEKTPRITSYPRPSWQLDCSLGSNLSSWQRLSQLIETNRPVAREIFTLHRQYQKALAQESFYQLKILGNRISVAQTLVEKYEEATKEISWITKTLFWLYHWRNPLQNSLSSFPKKETYEKDLFDLSEKERLRTKLSRITQKKGDYTITVSIGAGKKGADGKKIPLMGHKFSIERDGESCTFALFKGTPNKAVKVWNDFLDSCHLFWYGKPRPAASIACADGHFYVGEILWLKKSKNLEFTTIAQSLREALAKAPTDSASIGDWNSSRECSFYHNHYFTSAQILKAIEGINL